jgi:xylan 1,4-beta-xylosidase
VPYEHRHRFTPHIDGVRSSLRAATVDVDAQAPIGQIPPLWAAVGYDEINWTYTARGRRLLERLRAISSHPYYIRTHYLFCSGTGMSIPHWGSGNVYHEDEDGQPFYDFTISDQVLDAITQAGHVPLVELGFTPRKLVDDEVLGSFPWQTSATQYTRYEASGWSYPPKDHGRWGDLIRTLVEHCADRYGRDEVTGWLWELWNEPDIFYWRGTEEEFGRLYEVTVRAIRDVLPDARVGGPATTGDPVGPAFLRTFLQHCDDHDLPVDFVSFHTKGCYFTPNRVYGPVGGDPPELQSPSSLKMLREIRDSMEVIEGFPRFRDAPVIVDECDASVPAHLGVYDNANYGYRNTEYFPVFQAKLMKKILDLNEMSDSQVTVAMIWGFYFEGCRYFEGFRELVTNDDLDKPVLNAYRMFGKLHPQRYAATSDAAWSLDGLRSDDAGMPEEVDALATGDGDGGYVIAVWRHADDRYLDDDGPADVTLRVGGLPDGATASVDHWRIDERHSNSHTVWREMGSPREPTPDQLTVLHARAKLEQAEPHREVQVHDGAVTLSLELPLPSVSLVSLRLT